MIVRTDRVFVNSTIIVDTNIHAGSVRVEALSAWRCCTPQSPRKPHHGRSFRESEPYWCSPRTMNTSSSEKCFGPIQMVPAMIGEYGSSGRRSCLLVPCATHNCHRISRNITLFTILQKQLPYPRIRRVGYLENTGNDLYEGVKKIERTPTRAMAEYISGLVLLDKITVQNVAHRTATSRTSHRRTNTVGSH
jgi:hypothetical protein